jgi:predicted aminopeptidase
MKDKYEILKKNWPANIHFDNWFKKPINNARLTSSMTYLQNIPAFNSIFFEQQGNWEKFYRAVIALKKLDTEARERLIRKKALSAITYEKLVDLISKNLKMS